MKIALVRPRYYTHIITPPLGLGYLSSFLKSKGYETKIIDGLNKNYSNDKLVGKCKAYDIVGISCLSDYYLETIDLAKKLKEKTVVIGGPHASALPEQTLKETGADYVVVGEGELAFLDIIRGVKKKIIKKPFIKNLDEIPFPDWKQMDPRKYKKAPHGGLIKNFPVAPMVTSRGCPFECKFCSSPKLWGRRVRFRSPENVIEEIKFLVNECGVKEIHFEDDNLTLRKDHIMNISRLIIKNNIKISWACPNGIRADKLDKGTLRIMKKSGCYYLAFGIESGNQEILNNIKKKITLKKLENVIRMASKVGMLTQGFFIFGLPGETKETIENTINFAKRVPLDRAQFVLFDVLPGSELWDELNIKPNWRARSFQQVTWTPPTIDKDTLSKAPSRAFKSFFLRPKQLFRLFKFFRPSQTPFVIRRIIDWKILN